MRLFYVFSLCLYFFSCNAMEISAAKKKQMTNKLLRAALENLEPEELMQRPVEELSVLSYASLKQFPGSLIYKDYDTKKKFRALLLQKRQNHHKKTLMWVLETQKNFDCCYKELKNNIPMLWAIDELPDGDVYYFVNGLIQKGANVNRHYQDSGESALLRAAFRKLSNVVDLLLQYGADPKHADKEENTPLLVAAKEDSIECATTLLDVGQVDINWRNKRDKSALTCAIKKGKIDMVNFLLGRKALVTNRDKKLAKRSTLPQIRESVRNSK